jgi:hypothetical protein
MYSRKSWGGAVDPYIDVKILKPSNLADNEDPLVSLVIFEWQDRPLIGKQSDPDDPYSPVRMGEEMAGEWRTAEGEGEAMHGRLTDMQTD